MRLFNISGFISRLLLAGSFIFVWNSSAQHSPTNAAELSVKKLQPAPGLSMELFASEPLLANPVAFSIDERGRFFISETHRYKDAIFDITRQTNWLLNDLSFRTVSDRADFLEKEFATNRTFLTKDSELVRLVEDRDGDGRAETSSVFAEGFSAPTAGTAAGILARHGEVWFTCIPDLWKISESPGAASARSGADASRSIPNQSAALSRGAATKKVLSTGFGVHIGVSGHDLHGLVMGSDGKIYFSCGDRGFSVQTKEGNVLDYPDTGGVLRCDPDGSNMEVFATGLRNPQELAFDQFGNLFTDDNDTAGPDNSRVIYVVEGADYGWRASYQFMEGFGPWVQESNWLGRIDGTLPLSGEVAQGPSGLAFNPGLGLPEKYRNQFLVCDFPKGVWSFAVTPDGAGYKIAEKEKFLWNLGATDVEFGPDGSAYVSDWGQSYAMPGNGRIYRVFDPAQKGNPALMQVRNILSAGVSTRVTDDLAGFLDHADQRVRTEAQFELTKRKAFDVLLPVATTSPSELARIHAIWALGPLLKSSGSSGQAEKSILKTYPTLLADRNDEVAAQAAKTLGANATLFADELVRLLKHQSPRVRYFAAASLGKSKIKDAIGPIMEMLQQNENRDAYLVHAGVSALVNIGDFGAIQSAAKHENAAIRRAALLSMRRLQRPEIATFLNDTDPGLVREAARAINDAPINNAMPQLAALLNFAPNNNVDAQVMRRAINAHFRIGQSSNANALATFATNSTAPDSLRGEALDALADWASPNPLDRVMGLWRPLEKRPVSDAQKAFQSVSTTLFQSASEKVLLATVRAARKLELSDPALFPLFQTSTSAPVRVEILQALAEIRSPFLAQAVELALASKEGALRREGIKSVALLEPTQSPRLLEQLLLAENDLRIKQTALATLGNLTNAPAAEVLNRQMDLLLSGKVARGLQLDLLDAAGKQTDPALAEKLRRYQTSLPENDSIREFRSVLVGGDAARGKKIFHEREDAACLRCHAIKGVGGNVGPDLAGIAKTHPREFLLESILEPNKQIAAGFENIVVVLKNGSAAAGLVKSEDAKQLVLNSPEDGIVKIKKSDIDRRERGLSPMPEGVDKVLTKFELRDLIEYLAGLK